MPPASALTRLVAGAVLAFIAVAFYWSLRRMYADWRFRGDTIEQLQRAVDLAPGNAAYWVRLAMLLDDARREQDGQRALLEASRRSPLDSRVLIQLGLNAELRRDFPEAERRLVEAATIDQQYDPRWTLANYYFRRREDAKFWRWAREAIVIGELMDLTPLFRLCWEITPDPAGIRRLAVPDRERVLRQYLAFLLRRGVTPAGVALDFVNWAGPDDVPALLGVCDRLLEGGDGPGALAIWNRLAGRRLIAYPVRDSGRAAVSNGQFGLPIIERGFDWRLEDIEGVLPAHNPAERVLRLEFSGRQPEQCIPLWQYVPVTPGRRYIVRFDYATAGIAPGTGLRWRAADGARKAVFGESDALSSEADASGAFSFTPPQDVNVVRLELSYARALGTTRIEGTLTLRSVSMEPQP